MVTWTEAEAQEPRSTPAPSCARNLPAYYDERDAEAPWVAWVVVACVALVVGICVLRGAWALVVGVGR